MADLRSNFEGTLVTLRNQPFELRWARYWSMVLEALEYAPESLEYLNRLIIDQEDHLAAAEGRQTVARMLGAERDQLRREADAAVMELLQPFFNSEGSPTERAAIAAERRRIRSEIHPHAQRADGPDAYETYVLVLDYATAFATASASAFRTAATPRPQPRVVQPAPAANANASASANAAAPASPQMQAAQHVPQPPPEHRPPPRPQPEPQMRQRSAAPEPHAEARQHPPREAPRGEHRQPPPRGAPHPKQRRPRESHDPRHRQPPREREPQRQPPREREQQRQPPHEPEQQRQPHGSLQPVDQRGARPIPISMHPEKSRSRGGIVGWLVAILLIVCLAGAGSAAYVLKPEWFDPSNWTPTASTEDTTGTPEDTTAEDTTTETSTQTEQAEPAAEEVPSTALDRFYTAIVETKADACIPPPDIAKSNWSEISTFTDCAKAQGVELMSTFRFMLSQAGGKWSESGNWAVAPGPMQVQLAAAWRHITQTRNRWAAQGNAAVKEYASSYFGFQSQGTTGWRFAAWRCRCNLKGEFIAGDTANVKPRLFITPPALIQTEDEARQAYTQVRNFFLGVNAPGKPPAVEQAASGATLPFNLPGGLGMARPFETEEEAKKAWEEVSALHIGVGFEVNELKWGGN